MKKLISVSLLSAVLAAASVFAEESVTGNFGRMMMGGGGAGWVLGWLLNLALFVGVLLLVWLWVVKLWRELFRKKK